jgi:hypothetical protein
MAQRISRRARKQAPRPRNISKLVAFIPRRIVWSGGDFTLSGVPWREPANNFWQRGIVMTKKSAKQANDDIGSFGSEIRATREVWNSEMKLLKASDQKIIAQLQGFARNMFDSPLGRRAQNHPVAALSLASLLAMFCLRALRR